MKQVSKENLTGLLKQERIKSRLAKELRFQPEAVMDWNDFELYAIFTKSGNEGVLLVAPDEAIRVVRFVLTRKLTDKQTGRSKPVICDFCYTYQSGANAARITFTQKDELRSVGFLCCADLQCSLHVRDLTAASLRSRVQLREDLTPKQRVARLKHKLRELIVDGAARQ